MRCIPQDLVEDHMISSDWINQMLHTTSQRYQMQLECIYKSNMVLRKEERAKFPTMTTHQWQKCMSFCWALHYIPMTLHSSDKSTASSYLQAAPHVLMAAEYVNLFNLTPSISIFSISLRARRHNTLGSDNSASLSSFVVAMAF